jgi:hypothetical protein
MHSAIERAKKNTAVYCLSAWRSLTELARSRQPYSVQQLDYTALCNRNKDEDGNIMNGLQKEVLRFETATPNIVQYR